MLTPKSSSRLDLIQEASQVAIACVLTGFSPASIGSMRNLLRHALRERTTLANHSLEVSQRLLRKLDILSLKQARQRTIENAIAQLIERCALSGQEIYESNLDHETITRTFLERCRHELETYILRGDEEAWAIIQPTIKDFYALLLSSSELQTCMEFDFRQNLLKRLTGIEQLLEGNASNRENHKQKNQATYISIDRLPTTSSRLVGREAYINQLTELAMSDNINVATIVAIGGAGKSALLNKWLHNFLSEQQHDFTHVLGWSFYSQGSRQRSVSSEPFLDWALSLFDPGDTNTAGLYAKGRRLAEFIQKAKVLLVLDGLEPLQNSPTIDGTEPGGALRDQGVKGLLRSIAQDNPGVCIITSRLSVYELQRWEGHGCSNIFLEKLSKTEGTELLDELGVRGPRVEKESAVEELQGHALAITLLASYLERMYGSDIRCRDRLRARIDQADPYDDAHRVMEAYDNEWFRTSPSHRQLLLSVCQFDRPIPVSMARSVASTLTSEDATIHSQLSSKSVFSKILFDLSESHIVHMDGPQAPSDPDKQKIEVHPLVRE